MIASAEDSMHGKRRKTKMIKLIVVLVILAIVVVAVIRMQGNAYARFKADAIETVGLIEKKETRIESHHSQKRDEHVLIYSYTVKGEPYTGEDSIEYTDMWETAQAGMHLRVYYSKKDPSKSYPAAVLDRRLNIAEKVK